MNMQQPEPLASQNIPSRAAKTGVSLANARPRPRPPAATTSKVPQPSPGKPSVHMHVARTAAPISYAACSPPVTCDSYHPSPPPKPCTAPLQSTCIAPPTAATFHPLLPLLPLPHLQLLLPLLGSQPLSPLLPCCYRSGAHLPAAPPTAHRSRR